MHSRVNPRLSGRPLAFAVLAAFIGFSTAGAWLRVIAEAGPQHSDVGVRADKTASRGHVRQTKQGWPRKALVPKVVSAVQVAVAPKRPDDGQKLWAFIAAPAPAPRTRLEFCPEFTKSAALSIRSTGAPQFHRPPPAPVV